VAEPSVGRIVHYVSYGTPGGEFPSTCRAAVVTEVGPYYDGGGEGGHIVSLAVLNPSGLFFDTDIEQAEDVHKGGTWHWPERVDG
jgi:hypothetical protein